MTAKNHSEHSANDIPEMDLDRKYQKSPVMPENAEKMKAEMEKTQKELEKLKGFIVKKFPFTQAISILPPQSIKLFIDEEEVPKETEKYVHLHLIIPEENFKEVKKIKEEIVKEIERIKIQKIWLHIRSPVDIGEICMDSKFELSQAIAMSFPLHDKDGYLGALRFAEIHKSLVLQKFEKYVVSYVAYGSFIRGKMSKDAEVDIGIIINDTDVKRMPRVELRERLRTIIYQYVAEAASLAGVKNTLHPQTWLLTEFWDAVKDAHPVMFTFIRDGIPLYDRGTFLPWKTLLRMGKLRPSPESIDMFMRTAEKTKEMIDRRMLDAMVDIYYSVLNPSQAMVMLYGAPPPTHKETVSLMEDIFVKKEKLLKKTDIAILEKAVKSFKAYENDPKYVISGKEIDEMVKSTDEYLKKLKELRIKIDKMAQEKTIEQIYDDVFGLLKAMTGKKVQKEVVDAFEKDFVKKGKFPLNHLKIVNNIISARADFKKGKLDLHKVDNARKDASIIINELIEFTQRCELANLDKGRMRIKYKEKDKEKIAEMLIAGGETFLFKDNTVHKLTDKVENSDMDVVTKAIEKQKGKKNVEIDARVFALLKKELGEFEISL